MNLSSSFEIVEVAGEYLAVPIGNIAEEFGGVVVLNSSSAFLLRCMKKDVNVEELIELILSEYDIDYATAKTDIDAILEEFRKYGIIID